MVNPSVKFSSQAQSEFHPAGPSRSSAGSNPACIIYSDHPLALCTIRDAVCSDARLRPGVTPYCSTDSRELHGAQGQVLVLDTCSVENWRACLDKWQHEGRPAIALVSPELHSRDLELQMLYLGTAGVLTFADLPAHLPKAIYAVAEGRLWIRRDVLHTYVKQTSDVLRRCSSAEQKFTKREEQIMDLLLQNLPNRLIAQRLAVSERTIKFHVSNILHKLNIGSRKELRGMNSPAMVLSFRRPPVESTKPISLVISKLGCAKTLSE